MALSAAQIADLVLMTQDDLGKLQWTEIAVDIQRFHALPQMLQEEKVQFGSGTGSSWNIMVDDSGAARHTGLYSEDQVNTGDVWQTATIDFRQTESHYAFDRGEVARNRDPARIVDLIQGKRADAMISLAKLMEITWWGKPVDVNDEITPMGIPFWIVKSITGTSAAAGAGGFNGGNPAGFTAGAGGLSSATFPNWANWAHQYADVTVDDLIRKMRKAYAFTEFISPVPHPDYKRGEDRYVIYAPYDQVAEMEILAEKRNDNLQAELAHFGGQLTFRGNPVRWVPQLDSDSDNPIYFINWAVFFPIFLEGEYMVEDPPERAPNQHRVMQVFIDTTWNSRCTNRRLQAVLSTAADNP